MDLSYKERSCKKKWGLSFVIWMGKTAEFGREGRSWDWSFWTNLIFFFIFFGYFLFSRDEGVLVFEFLWKVKEIFW